MKIKKIALSTMLLSGWLCHAGTQAMADNNSSGIEHLKVTVKPLSALLVESNKSAPATVVSLNHVVLSAEITGKVLQLPVETGDKVARGAVLAKLDCSDYELAEKQAMAALQASRAQRELVQKQYQRNLQLRESKTIPQSLLDETVSQQQVSRADIAVKEAALAQSRLAVKRCTIKAPFAGQVTGRQASLGQLLTPNAPVLSLLQTDAIEVRAELTPSDIAAMQSSESLFFHYQQLRAPVELRAVIQQLQETSRTQEVRLKLLEDSTLVSGFAGRLYWSGRQALLPAEYILRRDGALGVMLVKDGEARFHMLPGAQEGQAARVELPADTRIIDLNRFIVRDKQPVDVQ